MFLVDRLERNIRCGWKNGELVAFAGFGSGRSMFHKSDFVGRQVVQAIADGKTVAIAGSEIDPKRIMANLFRSNDNMVAKNPPNVNVGDTVRLNDHGLEMIFGSPNGPEMHLKGVEMTITELEPGMTVGNRTVYPVHVDKPEFSKFFIDDTCFDKVGGKFKLGDIVKPTPNTGYHLTSGSRPYGAAIVVQSEPLVLSSVHGDMIWKTSVRPDLLDKIDEADDYTMGVLMKRPNVLRNLGVIE